MMNVNGSTGGAPNGTHYQVSTALDKGNLIVRVELENSKDSDKPIELLFTFPQAMEFRDEIEKAVWIISP